MSNYDYAYKSYVKDVYIELPDYKYLHGPLEIGDVLKNDKFVGRKKIIDRFLNILNSADKSGAYLVTGYRGMGKTSFVNKVIKEYDPHNKKTAVITICLNQNEIELKNVYKQIAIELKEKISRKRFNIYESNNFLPFIIISLLFVISYLAYCNGSIITDQSIIEVFILFLLSSSIIGYIVYQTCLAIIKRIDRKYRFFIELNNIIERASSELINEKGAQGAGNRFALGFIAKKTTKFPLANAKEIELELIRLFKKYKSIKEIIIIFDELDKVEPAIKKNFYYQDLDTLKKGNLYAELDSFRERKKLIIDILGSLKHFITRADARFIFIAGREMFDASLADINNRQSSVSSIFHQIINVDSFLKDKTYKNSRGITNLIEQYLKELLLPSKIFINQLGKKYNSEPLLQTYYNILPQHLKIEEKQKIIFILQHFLIYLTYRSNGTPNKLNRIIEDMIVNQPKKNNLKKIIITKESITTGRVKKKKKHLSLFLRKKIIKKNYF